MQLLAPSGAFLPCLLLPASCFLLPLSLTPPPDHDDAAGRSCPGKLARHRPSGDIDFERRDLVDLDARVGVAGLHQEHLAVHVDHHVAGTVIDHARPGLRQPAKMRADVTETGAVGLNANARHGSHEISERARITLLDIGTIDEIAATQPAALAELVQAIVERT